MLHQPDFIYLWAFGVGVVKICERIKISNQVLSNKTAE